MELRTRRIPRTIFHQTDMKALGAALSPEVLHGRVPRLGEVAEARAHYKNLRNDIQAIGKFTRATGFTPGENMQYIAQIDQSVWSAVCEVFGDELFKPEGGMNKSFFYALLAGPLAQYDMRGKITI